MPSVTVNGVAVEFTQGMTVLQTCELAGVEVPRFCYHDRLEIAGNCRMCLVEIEGGPPKPAASCAMPATDGMKVHTNTAMVKKAREGVMEFLLINHPLDCPICDQGGECDLQDEAMAYGRSASRYGESKRAVKDKYMGPLIKTHMTRCIHCTRCIRFMDDVAGVHELGAVQRGENMEVTTYVEHSLSSELSGNIVDLCPVGALTSRPYAFKARPWELKKTESVDVMDGVGSAIRIDSRGKEIFRILPRLSEEVNEEWLGDKSRHIVDALKVQRLDRAYLRGEEGFRSVAIEEAVLFVGETLSNSFASRIGIVAGPMTDMETMFAAKMLAESLRAPHIDCRFDGTRENVAHARSYRCHVPLQDMEKADFVLLVGCNPRVEAPILNVRLRKAWLNGATVAVVGERFEANYAAEFLGDNPFTLDHIAAGNHALSVALTKAKRPLIILGSSALKRDDVSVIENKCVAIVNRCESAEESFKRVNVLYDNAARVGGLYVEALPQEGGKSAQEIYRAAENGDMDAVILLGVDDYLPKSFGNARVIYVGHHGEAGAALADVILPGAAYTEKDALYMNVEGRVQSTARAVFPPGEARSDVELLLALLAAVTGEATATPTELRRDLLSRLPGIGEIAPAPHDFAEESRTRLAPAPLKQKIKDYYRTDVISRHSAVMAACASERSGKAKIGEAA
ncbi:MAG: NADH-quinone oxidoreductase subunit NuoG [Rickettsiales bacterium]